MGVKELKMKKKKISEKKKIDVSMQQGTTPYVGLTPRILCGVLTSTCFFRLIFSYLCQTLLKRRTACSLNTNFYACLTLRDSRLKK